MLVAGNRRQTEDPIHQKLIRRGLEAGYVVSIFDGEDWSVERSRDEAEILAACLSVSNFIKIRFRTMVGKFVGDAVLIYGDGDNVISDWTDNFDTNALMRDVLR